MYVDDQVWSKFRANVFQRHGSLKALSREVEKSLRSAIVEEEVLPYLSGLRASLNPKTRTRPAGRGPQAEVQIRKMRHRRFEDIS